MKKYMIMIMVIIGVLLTGCSASDDSAMEPSDYGEFNDVDGNLQDPEPSYEPADNAGGNQDTTDISDAVPGLEDRKIIYNASLQMKVLEPSEAYETVLTTMDSYHTYIEEASIKTDYYNLTIRVLSSEFDEFVEAIKTTGELVNYSKTSEDITNKYSTYEASKLALETRHARILELIEQADNLSTILELEEERYEIESQLNYIGAQLENFDSLVDYSTVELYITKATEEIIVLPRTEQVNVNFTEIEKNYIMVEVYNQSEENITLNIDVYKNGEFITEYEENMYADSKTEVTFDELESDSEYTFKVTSLASEHRVSLTDTLRAETLQTYGNKTTNTFTSSVHVLGLIFQFIGLAITGLIPFVVTGILIYVPIKYLLNRRGVKLLKRSKKRDEE